MIAQTIVRFPEPVMLDLRIASGPRARVVQPDPDLPAPDPDQPPPDPVLQKFNGLMCHTVLDANARTISAYLPPIPRHLPLYGPEDFASAAGDTMDDHANRVLQLLGSEPATVLQAMIDGEDLPPLPPRVPREIPNWRCKAVLTQMGIITQVEAIMAALPEPDRTIAQLAWHGDGKVARKGKTVLGLAAVLGLTDSQVDEMFIAADGIEV